MGKNMNNIFLSVIIPCYNEEENLKRNVLKHINDFFNKKSFNWEVIVSDDGSSDKGKSLVKDQIRSWQQFKLLENTHGGKPSALWHGIKAAKGKYVLFTDMDQSTPIEEFDKLFPFLNEKVGAVIGSRGLSRKNFPIYRRMGAVVFSTIRKIFILSEINDTQCGFKVFKRKVVEVAFPKLEFFRKDEKAKGWKVTSFDVELLHLIKKMGYIIVEVPVRWEDVDVSISKGGSLYRYIRESFEMIMQIFRVKLNDIKGLYKI
jgi:dolichyl-phosphate beta-glucosyltransferase